MSDATPGRTAGLEKDRVLDALARHGNVAQFVSFGPRLELRFNRLHGEEPNRPFDGPDAAIRALFEKSEERSINLRSYTPEEPRSRRFLYGLRSVDEALAALRGLATDGLFVIANETVDVRDGGVSGVAAGDVVEFAPDDTPRCVEKPGTVCFPRREGLAALRAVYDVDLTDALPADRRTEFSVHPARRGVRHEHLLVWESEPADAATPAPVRPRWPNLFSRHVGDKAFGLLAGAVFGLPVPRTTVIARRVRPFAFGEDTGATETWLRTCPLTQEPGKFTTLKGWTDPFKLFAAEDPLHERLASVLSQQAVPALWSGAALTTADGTPIVEGVRGAGDSFMLGVRGPEGLPAEVAQAVRTLWTRAFDALGPVRFEWAFDGARAWLLQLHAETSPSDGSAIYPGEAAAFVRYDTSRGLEGLRAVVAALAPGEGVELVGAVGLTSHFADLLRKARVPSRIAASAHA